jgi:ferredoxin-NADP reductase
VDLSRARPVREETDRFAGDLQRAVEGADTFFIATGHRGEGEAPAFGMDASHRGGAAGFVRVAGERSLLIPDYAGNNHFNTLGNLELDSRAGLLFVDFERGDLFQLTGQAVVEWDHPETGSFPGARRLVRFELESAVVLRGALPLRFSGEAAAARSLRVVAKQQESADVVSLVFEARDGAPLPRFAAGQYLPIEVTLPGQQEPVQRTYSLSSGPDDRAYRISVKREPQGAVSRHLHDVVQAGHILASLPPSGDFRLDHEGQRPVVLVSAGIGVTPMVSMLRDLSHNSHRRVLFVHGARDGAHHALQREVELLSERRPGIDLHVAYSRPRPEDAPGRDYHSEGRVDVCTLEKLLPGLDADYYLCGPNAFVAGLQSQLEAAGVRPEQIRFESFGPAG